MLYRQTVDNILSQFNITDAKFNRMIQQATFEMTNEKGVAFTYIVDKPLYYVLEKSGSNVYSHTDSGLFIPTDLYDRYETYLRVLPLTVDMDYLDKYKTIKTDDWYSNEYWNQYTDTDIDDLLSLSGISDLTVTDVFGKFILTDDHKLRFLFDPVGVVYDDVDFVYQSDLFLYYHQGTTHVVYYVIFRNQAGEKFVIYHSGVVNLVGASSTKIIPLVNYFTNIGNIKVVYNIYNLAIFENKPVGCRRLLVNGFSKSFFHQAYNNFHFATTSYSYSTFWSSDTPPSGFMPSDIPPNAKIINKELLGQTSINFKTVESNNAVGDIIFAVGDLDISVMYYA